ncbi:uncharacterized protein LOC126737277 isoform X1 [Anthonomus grandis grandis]|uniref:uncharacterized protein LOC126737277 isoform X1 n=1 Tax=Anthonomus grandis grandis TaxID=2921223 RepID=UPI002165A52D|nr:uncharacterized protein LOC126737277 isoform X1 [Anthonomus grandis grandis]
MLLKFCPVLLGSLIGVLASQKPYLLKEKNHMNSPLTSPNDQSFAESGLVGSAQPAALNHGAVSKYFQDIYMAQHNPKEIEFGHVFENSNDWEQRFEKINLDNLSRQGKVRWGDKHGGYGEHYWDLNHAGHGGESDAEETEQSDIYAEYPQETQTSNVLLNPNNQRTFSRSKRNPDDDVEFINEKAKSIILNDRTPKHGGNYRNAKKSRSKRSTTNKYYFKNKYH